MTYTPIAKDSADWDVPVNAAFTSQDSRLTTAETNIATNSTSITTLNGQMSTANTNITNLQNADNGLASGAALGYLGWAFDPTTVGTGQTGTAGTVYLSRINVGQSATATKLIWGINTAGSGVTAGQNFVALFNSSGTRLANVGVDARITTTGVFAETINVALTPGFYWVAILVNATSMPAIYRGGFLNGTLVNGVLPASAARFATNGTGLTAMPSSITPGSNSFSQSTYYAALTV